MRTLSVKEVADALGMTKRGVMYRLDGGKLKGTLVQNSHGQEEWRIYPNKEIMSALQAKAGKQEVHLNFSPDDIVDSLVIEDGETVDDPEEHVEVEGGRSKDFDKMLEMFREQFAPELVAEKLMRPLVEKLEAQQELLFNQRQELADKDRQLKLLPDLQRQAEHRAQERDLLHVENQALKKQVDAMKEQLTSEKDELSRQLDEAHSKQQLLETELTQAKKSWVQKLFGR